MVSGVHDAHDEGVASSNAVYEARGEFIDRAVAQLMRRAPRPAVSAPPDALAGATHEAECPRHARDAEQVDAIAAKSRVSSTIAELARVRALLAADDIRSSREWAVRTLARAEGDRTIADAALPAALGTLGLIAWDGGRVADALELMRAATGWGNCDVAGNVLHPRLSLVA